MGMKCEVTVQVEATRTWTLTRTRKDSDVLLNKLIGKEEKYGWPFIE
jgi:hypothetical protein